MQTRIIHIFVILIAVLFYYGEAEGEQPCPIGGMSGSIYISNFYEKTSYNEDIVYDEDYIKCPVKWKDETKTKKERKEVKYFFRAGPKVKNGKTIKSAADKLGMYIPIKPTMESIPWTDKKGKEVSEFVYIPLNKNHNSERVRFTFIRVELTTKWRNDKKLDEEYKENAEISLPWFKWKEDSEKLLFDQGVPLIKQPKPKLYKFNAEEILQLNAYLQELLEILDAQNSMYSLLNASL